VSSNPIIVAFDVETTGLVAGVDRVVELAAVAFRGDEIIEAFSRLVNPGVPMPPVAARITGITPELLARAPPPAAALPELLSVLARGTPVAHNAAFDVAFLGDELESAGLAAPEGPVLDTRGLARRAFPGRYSYGLANLSRDLALAAPRAHRALADADTCRQLFQVCVKKLGSDGLAAGAAPGLPLADLMRLSGAPLDFAAHAPRLPRIARLLKQAITAGTMVDICYRSVEGALTGRRIRPLEISVVGGNVAVVAHCMLRNDKRTFFLDSITEARHCP
jgi:DNA polymerase III epsilon subunit family exonuclease